MAYPTYVAATTLVPLAGGAAVVGGVVTHGLGPVPGPDDGRARCVVVGHRRTHRSRGSRASPPRTSRAWFLWAWSIVGRDPRCCPRSTCLIAQPAALFLWVYVSSVLAAAVFFDRPGVALVGGVAMGLVALPFAWRLWDARG